MPDGLLGYFRYLEVRDPRGYREIISIAMALWKSLLCEIEENEVIASDLCHEDEDDQHHSAGDQLKVHCELNGACSARGAEASATHIAPA